MLDLLEADFGLNVEGPVTEIVPKTVLKAQATKFVEQVAATTASSSSDGDQGNSIVLLRRRPRQQASSSLDGDQGNRNGNSFKGESTSDEDGEQVAAIPITPIPTAAVPTFHAQTITTTQSLLWSKIIIYTTISSIA
ncbi:hypothetical protein EJ08DRAFT_701775 [Tothia fuscella]|uniref:Uncharacterized protein n=1 Tax=Tothia fuscella TaxID=1048955 RepID=A0A9P4TUI2_9PEZI|nr:hypothetical protein EJ08DRAFT_701775 [Tothia fuscella]